MALFKNWPVEKQGGLGSLFPGKGGERIKPLPPTRRPLEQPGTWLVPPDRPIEAPVMPIGPRPPIGGPDGPMPPRPPGESAMAKIRQLKAQRQQLREQLREIEFQIRSLSGGRKRSPWDDLRGGTSKASNEAVATTFPWDSASNDAGPWPY